MLPKLKILMLLSIMTAKNLSGPTNATGPLAIGSRSEDLEKELARMNMTMSRFNGLVSYSEFELGWSMNFFNPKLLKAVLNDPDNDKRNVAVGPSTIHAAIMMLYYASPIGSTTHQQIADALGLRDTNIPTYLGNSWGMLNYFDSHDTGLTMANGIFIKSGFSIEPNYIRRLHAFLGTIPKNLDMDNAEKDINEFVSNNTNGLIPNLLQPGSIDTRKTSVALVNALHHKGKWLHDFDKTRTDRMDFTLLDGKVVDVEKGMWLESSALRYAKAEHRGKIYFVLELPYEKGFKMFVTLPEENTRDDVTQAALIDPGDLEDDFQCDLNGLVVNMPGFEIEYDTSLVKYLESLGLTDMFDAKKADFSEMTGEGTTVTEVQTKVIVKVDEEGSDTAASSALWFCTRANTGKTELIFNRPFAYRIVDNEYKINVLTGIVLDPRKQPNP